MSKEYTSNDMKSMVHNPTSSHYNAAMNNHSNQLNSNNDAYWSSRIEKQDFYGVDDFFIDYEGIKTDVKID